MVMEKYPNGFIRASFSSVRSVWVWGVVEGFYYPSLLSFSLGWKFSEDIGKSFKGF